MGRISLLEEKAKRVADEIETKVGFKVEDYELDLISAQLHVFFWITSHGIAAEWAHPAGACEHHIYLPEAKGKNECGVRVWLCRAAGDYKAMPDFGAEYTIVVRAGKTETEEVFTVVGYVEGTSRVLKEIQAAAPDTLFSHKWAVGERRGDTKRKTKGKGGRKKKEQDSEENKADDEAESVPPSDSQTVDSDQEVDKQSANMSPGGSSEHSQESIATGEEKQTPNIPLSDTDDDPLGIF